MFEIYRECTFAAAHQLLNYRGKCERLHGHNWKIGVCLIGPELDNAGMLLDFHELDSMIKSAVLKFDHRNLNEVEPFSNDLSPSSERLASVIFEHISRQLPDTGDISVKYCDVWENELSRARYYPD
jgi:6-pyruvoyltetrahydropterin/6-carboxytetrahydropterin synthase